MGQIISEGLEYIGRIDDDGYVFDKSGNCAARITDAGYISELGRNNTFGKIDEDGVIRDASLNVVGRIQADGYVFIHSKRICKVSSSFLERITPNAWNAGEISSYPGNKKAEKHSVYKEPSSGATNFFLSPFFIKLVIGIVLGIIAMANGWGGIGMLVAGPVIVFLLCFIAKLFG